MLRCSLLLQILAITVSANWTTQPPCCRDAIASTTCRRLMSLNQNAFARRCNRDAEFRLVQCCSTCNKSKKAMAYDLVARSLVDEQCFDRHGEEFCARYVNGTDVFSDSKWSCDGKHPHLGFRTCRKSCGYCNFKVVRYTLENAEKACGGPVEKKTWRDYLFLNQLNQKKD